MQRSTQRICRSEEFNWGPKTNYWWTKKSIDELKQAVDEQKLTIDDYNRKILRLDALTAEHSIELAKVKESQLIGPSFGAWANPLFSSTNGNKTQLNDDAVQLVTVVSQEMKDIKKREKKL